MAGFWDASALVPLCLPGLAGQEGRRLLKEQTPVVWWGTPIEVASALARLAREGYLDAAQAGIAAGRLALLRRSWREVQPVHEVREIAEEQLRFYPLRAADALQLAAALVWCNRRPRRRAFVCRDQRLGDAASRAGFTAIDF